MTAQGETLQIVGPKNTFPAVSLIAPTQSGYLLLAVEVDHRPPIGFFVESRCKKKLLAQLKNFTTALAESDDVFDARENAHNVMCISASNTRRIGPVDHSRNGVFLFNYFYADSLDINLQVWNYTAGWFQDQTGLDNSTVLLPDEANQVPYTIINHCRWDGLRNILPALLFNRSFKPFVLNNFEQNNTAAIPVLYNLA